MVSDTKKHRLQRACARPDLGWAWVEGSEGFSEEVLVQVENLTVKTELGSGQRSGLSGMGTAHTWSWSGEHMGQLREGEARGAGSRGRGADAGPVRASCPALFLTPGAPRVVPLPCTVLRAAGQQAPHILRRQVPRLFSPYRWQDLGLDVRDVQSVSQSYMAAQWRSLGFSTLSSNSRACPACAFTAHSFIALIKTVNKRQTSQVQRSIKNFPAASCSEM